ncbi:MAG: hypothetical protein RR374_01350 [Clostridia bacterium]
MKPIEIVVIVVATLLVIFTIVFNIKRKKKCAGGCANCHNSACANCACSKPNKSGESAKEDSIQCAKEKSKVEDNTKNMPK